MSCNHVKEVCTMVTSYKCIALILNDLKQFIFGLASKQHLVLSYAFQSRMSYYDKCLKVTRCVNKEM